jgi:hypothetical protein
MQVSIDEIGVDEIRKAEFFVGISLSDRTQIYFAPLDKEGGLNQRWMVLSDDSCGREDGSITVFTTEEMRVLCRSLRGFDGGPVRASEEMGYHFLIHSGKIRMKLRDGCPGCRRFWGRDSEGQCSRCHRCLACCGKLSVPFSCGSGYINKEAKRRYARRRK